jgi:hypothetical protein
MRYVWLQLLYKSEGANIGQQPEALSSLDARTFSEVENAVQGLINTLRTDRIRGGGGGGGCRGWG